MNGSAEPTAGPSGVGETVRFFAITITFILRKLKGVVRGIQSIMNLSPYKKNYHRKFARVFLFLKIILIIIQEKISMFKYNLI